MASNDPVLESVGLTHLGSPKALLGKRGGPLLSELATSHFGATCWIWLLASS